MKLTATLVVLACVLLSVANGIPTRNVDEQALEHKGEPFLHCHHSDLGKPSDLAMTVSGIEMVCLHLVLVDVSLLQTEGILCA